MFFAIDGNFVNNRKAKKSDPNDFPLTLGASYFANEKDTKQYLKTLGPLELEVSLKRSLQLPSLPTVITIAFYVPQVRRHELCGTYG